MAEDEKARDEMIKKTGRMAVPTIAIGDHMIVGFNRGELDRFIH